MENGHVTFSSTAPDWIIAFLEEIDSKRFGKPFEIFDASGEMCFGSGHWHGIEEIRANLQKLDGVMDTKHVVDGFWDAGEVKIIRGRVEMTKHDTGETVKPAMVHIFTMSSNEPGKVRQTYGAVGPEKL